MFLAGAGTFLGGAGLPFAGAGLDWVGEIVLWAVRGQAGFFGRYLRFCS